MSTKVFIGVCCGLALVTQVSAQEITIGREGASKAPEADAAAIKETLDELRPQKAVAVQPVKATAPEVKPGVGKPVTTAQAPAQKTAPASQRVTVPEVRKADKPAMTAQIPAPKPAAAPQTPTIEIHTAKTTTPASPEVKPPKPEPAPPVQSVAVSPVVTKPAVPEPARSVAPIKPATSTVASSAPNKPAAPAVTASAPSKPAAAPVVASVPNKPATAVSVGSAPAKLNRDADRFPSPPLNSSGATAFTKLAGGFDFPIGKPDAKGYYKARGFQTRGHLGEDWDGTGGGDTDMGDPVFCIGDGVVVFARDCHQGWGNVIIVRHAYREGGSVRNIDSLYAHCQKILVRRGQTVARGQQIAAIGNAHGLYDAHLHFEIRKNLAIGMSRDKFAKDLSNYCDPTQFIATHRALPSAGGNWRIAMNTFTYDEKIKWDKLRNYRTARTGGGSGQSARNLKKAIAAQSVSTRTN